MPRAAGTVRLFVDQVTIKVRAGRGGDGCVSFRREKYVPKGGPDGGDGGNGGSVYLEAHTGVDTLLDLAGKHHWRAEHGRPGSGKGKHGRNGQDMIIIVPAGTLVYDADSGRLLKDLVHDQQRVCVARGGRGGHGNAHFATATHQTPREAEPGRPAQERTLRLELKLIADVGLIGLPNAGKSTLLARLTRARPKIAPYPFTTTEPQLGIMELSGYRRLVLADIPGLIEGAHTGVGLGDEFLRHIERTRVLVHLVDLCPPPGSPAPEAAYGIIRRELEKYSVELARRPELVVASKLDLTGARKQLTVLEEKLAVLRAEFGSAAAPSPLLVRGISGVTGEGLKELAEAMWLAVEEARRLEREAEKPRIELG